MTAAARLVSGAWARIVSSPGLSLIRRTSSSTACSGSGRCARPREERVAHAVLAVHVLGSDPLGDQRLGAAGVDGNLAASAGHLDRVQGVLDLLLEGDVAAADGDRLEAGTRVRAGAISSEKTSSPAVSVSMIRRVMQPPRRAAPRAARGSAGRRSRPRARPCARRPRSPSARPRASGAPSASATANAAQNASPAPVVSTGVAGNAGICAAAQLGAPWSPSVTTSVPSRILHGEGLALVRRQVVGGRRDRARRRRRRVQDRAHACGATDLERMQSGVDRDLQLDEQDVGGLDLRREGVDVRRCQRRERAGDDHDPVVAARLDQDRRGHRRQRRAQDRTRVDRLLRPRARRRRPRRRPSPTAVRNVTSAPRRAAPTAWFDPLPPWSVRNSDPTSVSPRSGARSTPKVSPTP